MSEENTYMQRAKHDKEHPFVMISKNMFRDPHLSVKAKGTLGYLLTLPDDWKVHPTHIAKTLNIGRNQIYQIINDLIDNGYCNRILSRDSKGKILKTVYEFCEDKRFKSHSGKEPNTQNGEMAHNKCQPFPQNQDLDNQDLENGHITEDIRKTDNVCLFVPASGSKNILSEDKEEIPPDLLVLRHRTKNVTSAKICDLISFFKQMLYSEAEIVEAIDLAKSNDPIISSTVEKYIEGILTNKESHRKLKENLEKKAKNAKRTTPRNHNNETDLQRSARELKNEPLIRQPKIRS